ncbi:unnamed protein product [Lota lota]
MCVAKCLRCVAMMLVALAIICILANVLLLLPGLNIYFLLKGHVTREATWGTGIWSSGILVLVGARAFMTSSKTNGCCSFRTQMCFQLGYSALVLLGSGFCCWVSLTGLVQGPLCLYNTSSGQVWGVPLQPYPDRFPGYLYNRTMWEGVCESPRRVVQWNLVLFSILALSSALQLLLTAGNLLNLLLGVLLDMDHLNSSHFPTSQSEFSSRFTQQVLPALYLLVCVVGVVLNGPAAWFLLRVPSERPLVVYLKNMVGADLLLLSTLPLKVGAELGLGGRGLHVAVCRYSAVLFYSSMYVGIVFMGLISLDRYITITRRASSLLHRVGVARLLALVIWCLLLLSVLPNAVLTSRSSLPNSSVSCMELKTPLGLQWHSASTLSSVALFWATLLLLCSCYASIARRVYRSSRRERGGGGPCRRSGRSIVVLLLVFLLCFVPYHACRVPYTLSQTPGARYTHHTRYVLFQLKEATLLLSSVNVCLDPLIYFFMCRSFRESLLRKMAGGEQRRRGEERS